MFEFSGGQAVPEGSINAFIHVVMYTYYLIAGLGPQYQKYLWWKKHLTTMQLVSFIRHHHDQLILVHCWALRPP